MPIFPRDYPIPAAIWDPVYYHDDPLREVTVINVVCTADALGPDKETYQVSELLTMTTVGQGKDFRWSSYVIALPIKIEVAQNPHPLSGMESFELYGGAPNDSSRIKVWSRSAIPPRQPTTGNNVKRRYTVANGLQCKAFGGAFVSPRPGPP
ncbi:hypothetical protein Bbelb_237300 [Branchiostoma belcheri]|nr:hypothetical protein Bbelb_237300 [Branchiostoma belcheri]